MPCTYRLVEKPVRSAVITGFEGSPKFIEIPSEVEGLPVLEIGDHAFAGRSELLEVEIPDGVSGIGRYAFYNCLNLRELRLTDSVQDFGDGVLRMCRGLRRISIDLKNGYYRLIKDLIEDMDSVIRFKLIMPDGQTAKLTFPGFAAEVREDDEAKYIHMSIVGAGFTYRQAVTRKGIDFDAYDWSFERVVMIKDVTAAEIALERLECPYELSERAELIYRTYLSENARLILSDLIRQDDIAGVRILTDKIEVEKEVLDAALVLASEGHQTEICGLIMEAIRKKEPENVGAGTFSLDDF